MLSDGEQARCDLIALRLGLEQFPNDYELHEALAMKLWWDLAPEDPEEVRKNRTEAARIAERAMRLPSAPPAAATRIAAMWGMLGEVEHARATLRQMLLTTENKEARAKMIERFREIAGDLGSKKAQRILDTQADCVATGNIGCLTQLRHHLSEIRGDEAPPIRHTVEILADAYRRGDRNL